MNMLPRARPSHKATPSRPRAAPVERAGCILVSTREIGPCRKERGRACEERVC